MEVLSVLLDRALQSEQARLGFDHTTPHYRWMVEATNRIQELQHRVEIKDVNEALDEIAGTYVFVAYRSVPDYTAPSPAMLSIHWTLEGAIHALYPDREDFRNKFTKRGNKDEWQGPDGFGMVRKIEVKG